MASSLEAIDVNSHALVPSFVEFAFPCTLSPWVILADHGFTDLPFGEFCLALDDYD
jgi:hypothetical protein